MTLRREIHSTFDRIAPSTYGLSERVVHGALVRGASRPRTGRVLLRLRAPLALVAGFLLVAIVTLALIGDRLMQDWSAFHSSAAAGAAYRAQIASLEARPLTLPIYSSRSQCTPGPFNADHTQLGEGPLYTYGGNYWITGWTDYYPVSTRTGWGDYYRYVLYTDQLISGPILVRGRDLVEGTIVVFVGRFAYGSIVGSDVLSGARVQQRPEVVLNENDAPPVRDNPPAVPHAFAWEFTLATQLNARGGTGLQIDGTGFTDRIVLC